MNQQRESNYVPTRILILITTVSAVFLLCSGLVCIVTAILNAEGSNLISVVELVPSILIIAFNVLLMFQVKSVKKAERYKRWLSIPVFLIVGFYALLVFAALYTWIFDTLPPHYEGMSQAWYATARIFQILPYIVVMVLLAIIALVMLISPRCKAPWVTVLALLCAVSVWSMRILAIGNYLMSVDFMNGAYLAFYVIGYITEILILVELTLLLIPSKTVANPLPVEEDDPDSPAITGGSE